MFADANAGLQPDDPAYLDTTPGGFFYDIVNTAVLEIDRLWDAAGAEMIAAAFPAYAWGTYLDEHALTVGLTRKPAVRAVGEVTFTGVEGTLIATGTEVGAEQTEPDSPPVTFLTTEQATIPAGLSVDVPVAASEAGTDGNVASGSITTVLSPLEGIAGITNAQPTRSGAEIEPDEALRNRVLLAYGGAQGSGTISDYQAWALAYPGVGYVGVEPIWNGPGTVRVTVTDALNRPVATQTVEGLQELLDPVAGEGRGLAPVGATVTVATPTVEVVDVAASVTTLPGYTLDGTGGTIAVRADLEDAIRSYMDRLPPGDDVVYKHVLARFFEVAGVVDVPTLTLDGGTTNVAIGATQVAQTGTVNLTT
jgi:uncharacterized phage protein gp47/JayE